MTGTIRHLAEFNRGVLRHDWDDLRVADFVNGLDLVNGVAARSDGFIWRLPDADMETAQNDGDGPLGGNPRLASTLSVWRDAAALEHFVWNTVHKSFYARKSEWYAPGQGVRLVMWWIPVGHCPTVAEAAARLDHLERNGDSDFAFGWRGLKEAQLWRAKQCNQGEQQDLEAL
ncbi:MAG: DUF3291 domain-containing protein [Sedimentitalea sp.]